MAYSKYIGYGGTATLIGLITWFFISSHFLVEYEGDKFCDGTYGNICEWKYNVTLKTISAYYIYNKDSINLNFVPDVKQVWHCKIDGRYTASWREDRELAPCGVGWREFDWKTPLTEKYNYIEKFIKNKKHEYKIVVLKFNPTDTVKFGGRITGNEFDPRLLPRISILKECKDIIGKVPIKANVTHYKKVILFCETNVSYIYLNNISLITAEETRYEIKNFSCGTGLEPYISEDVVDFADSVIGTECENIGFNISGRLVYDKKFDYKCSFNEIIECDSIKDGNGDGKCSSGESCIKIDIRDFSISSRIDSKGLKGIEIK